MVRVRAGWNGNFYIALAFRYNLFMEAITVNGRAPLSKITCLQLQRIDLMVRHVHIARPCDWLRLAAVRSAPPAFGFVSSAGKEGKSRIETGTDLRSAVRSVTCSTIR